MCLWGAAPLATLAASRLARPWLHIICGREETIIPSGFLSPIEHTCWNWRGVAKGARGLWKILPQLSKLYVINVDGIVFGCMCGFP